ncbi:MAG: winged helix-turn-helix transcriptional regulator [bacterium]|nr:winged helix-turn-helix transcriptional regulator [bacterium]
MADARDRLILNLQELADLFAWRRSQLAAEAGLRESEWRMLEEVESEHFLPSLFARERACTPAAVSKTLRALQEAGLVRARIDSEDGRRRRYSLTAAGGRRLRALRTAREEALRVIWSDLPERELARFARFSEGLVDRLRSYAKDQEPEMQKARSAS